MLQSVKRSEFTKGFDLYSETWINDPEFIQSDPITLKSILKSKILFRKKYQIVSKWFLTFMENTQVSLVMNEMLLPIFEKKYPENKSSRLMIETTKKFLNNEICEHTYKIAFNQFCESKELNKGGELYEELEVLYSSKVNEKKLLKILKDFCKNKNK